MYDREINFVIYPVISGKWTLDLQKLYDLYKSSLGSKMMDTDALVFLNSLHLSSGFSHPGM